MKELPSAVEAERFVLGSVLVDDSVFADLAVTLKPEDLTREDHRRIYQRMSDIYGREESITYISLAEELKKHKEFDRIGGLTVLTALTDGVYQVDNLDSHIRILKEKTGKRKLLYACQNIQARVELGDPSAEIVAAAQETLAGIASRTGKAMTIASLPAVRGCVNAQIEYIRCPELPKGAVVALTGDSGSGKSTLATVWARDVDVRVLFLDRENPLSVITDRLDRLGFDDGPRLRFWGGWLPEEAPLPDAPAVIEWVKEHDGNVMVVVDSLVAFQPGDENSAGETRAFMHRCRRLADQGATVIVVHHDGKSETARDFRGSSDFKAAIDIGFHVSNFGVDGHLDKLVLRPFKQRIQVGEQLVYEYASGRFLRGEERDAKQTITEQLMVILRLNPGVTARKFDELVGGRGLGRNRGRGFLADGLLSGTVRRETAANNEKRHFLVEKTDAV